MTAGVKNIVIEQGATFTWNLIWNDSTSTPVDLTGYTARMQVRKTKASTEKLLDLTTENGGITLGGALGTIAVVASAALTEAVDAKSGVYDLELESASGVVKRLIEGEVTISLEVTR